MDKENTNPSVPNNATDQPVVTQTPTTDQPVSQPEAKQPEAPVAPTATEPTVDGEAKKQVADKMVPYQALKEARAKERKAMRELAKYQNQSQFGQYDPEELGSVRNHPYVQQLEIKQAEAELKRGTEEVFENYPNIPAHIRKAILRNPRGFVSPTTTDVSQALSDIESYLESLNEELADASPAPAPEAPKAFPVAGMNAPAATTGPNIPAEVQRILSKPMDEWTEADNKVIDDAKKLKGIRGL